MYHFSTMNDLKKEVYKFVDQYHTSYLMDIKDENKMKKIGLNYIRFAVEEKNLFRFLSQTNEFFGKNITTLIDYESLSPIISILIFECGITKDKAKTLFRTLFLIVHGYASIFANNQMSYNEKEVSNDLDLVFDGVILKLKGERNV